MNDASRAFDDAGRKYHDEPTMGNFAVFMSAGKRLDEVESVSTVTTATPMDNATNDPHPRVVANGAIDGAVSKSRRFTSEELESL